MPRATDSGSRRRSSSGDPGTTSGFRGSSSGVAARRGREPKLDVRRRLDDRSVTGDSEVGGCGRGGRRVQRGADPQLLLDLLLDLVGEVGVVPQEVADVLLALAELVALVGVPSAGLLHEALLDTGIDDAALAAEALPPEQVELGLLERGSDLVLHDLDPDPAADRVGALLEGLDAAHVE